LSKKKSTRREKAGKILRFRGGRKKAEQGARTTRCKKATAKKKTNIGERAQCFFHTQPITRTPEHEGQKG